MRWGARRSAASESSPGNASSRSIRARSLACRGSTPAPSPASPRAGCAGGLSRLDRSSDPRLADSREHRGDTRVRVLDVVDVVLLGLLAREVEVEVDGRVVGAREQVPARRVDADLGDQVVERDEFAGALGHLGALPRAKEVDELHDQQLQLVGVAAERRVGGPQTRHVAVVVSPPHVDLAGEATLALVLGVGDVRGEVSVLAGGADQHAVLVVAELARAQPQGALARVRAALLGEHRQRVPDGARIAFVQNALVLPVVERGDGEARQRLLHAPDHHRDRRSPQLAGIRSRRIGEARGELLDVVAAIAVLRDRLAAGERGDRLAQLAHLRAGVVDIELTRDLVAVEREHARERIAVGGVTGVTDVHRPRGVRRDELHEDPLGLPRPAGAIALAGRECLPERAAKPGIRDEQVQEPRAGHLEALEARPEALP